MFDKLKIWLRGDSNWKAEQELDRLGKDDAFLADAMDGYRATPEGDHTKAVDDLRARLASRTEKKRGFIYWRSIAAAAALIGVIGLFFWTQREVGRSEVLVDASALEKEKDKTTTFAPSAPNDIGDSGILHMKSEKTAESVSSAEKAETTNKPLVSIETQKKQAKLKVDPSNIEAGIIEADSEVAYAYDISVPTIEEAEPVFEDLIVKDEAAEMADVREGKAIIMDKEAVSSEDAVLTAPAMAATEKKREAEIAQKAKKEMTVGKLKQVMAREADANISKEIKVLNGTITDISTGESLIGASILVKGTNDGTTTNFDGNFTLQSSHALPWTLVVSYTGYTNQELLVSNLEKPLTIVLDNDGLALNEIVVTSSGQRKEKRSQKNSIQSPKPKSSFKKLERYIKKNLKYPEIAKQNRVEGAVTVRFFINADGKPEQLSVLDTLGSGCDEEAMRLIGEGPKWKPMNTWTTYSVNFELK